MSSAMKGRTYRAGQSIEDHCRQCHEDRMHTVIVVDGGFQPIRTRCDFCGSDHNFRGARTAGATANEPLVRPRERRFPSMSHDASTSDLETLIRTIIREETGLTPVAPAEKWRGGELVLRPGRPGLQEKTLPIDTFFNKVVMLRNRLRTLEQHVNASELPTDQKIKLQAYITGCYGSLTTFNVLFADDDDRFVGSGE
jgi:hypothetical protein